MNPEGIWKEALRGSEVAWKELYQLFGPRLYNFFLKNIGDIEVAMDKTQEVFEKLYRKKTSFIEGNLKSWIFRIAKNLLIDWWRGRKNFQVAVEEPFDIPDGQPAIDSQVIDKLDREELLRYLDEALEKLGMEERIIVGLVYLGGITISELSQIMELPLGTAKTKVRQARLKLDRFIASRCVISEFKKE
ncbi:MAG: RNA polymerase sigma factor [Candidatus Riflebacteria bacterium]|nr:RNA polymerase sigma factor [Candidatus Riflebacteria bacterium]